jgi:transcriptional regulator with XRE-family HTH domain
VDEAKRDGARISELRALRGKSLRVIAGLAGISASYLSRVERGERTLDSRKTLYALADALQVAPYELTGQPYAPSNADEAVAHAAAHALRAVLRDAEIDELPDTSHVLLRELEEAVDRADRAAAASNYAELGTSVPDLLGELFIPHSGDQQSRTQLLVRALHDAFYLSKDLGHGDLAWAVSGHLERAATRLGEPTWGAVAGFVRSHAVTGARPKPRALSLARHAAEVVLPGNGVEGQVYGMCHLSAALHSAAIGMPDQARDHLSEAEDVARHTGEGTFGGLMFGPTNVGVWQLAVHLELGDIGRGLNVASKVNVAKLPSAGRQATFYSDLGLTLSRVRGRDEQAVEAIRRAEQLAPSLVRTRPPVRAAVTVLLHRTKKESVRRELRGLAHRMGIAA